MCIPLAGMFDPTPVSEDRMMQAHVLATRGLLRAAEKAGVPVWCTVQHYGRFRIQSLMARRSIP